MTIAWSTFAREVKQTRKARYFSQRGLAEKLGICYSIIARAENGAPLKVSGFLALCAWMDADPFSYLQNAAVRDSRPLEGFDRIRALLVSLGEK